MNTLPRTPKLAGILKKHHNREVIINSKRMPKNNLPVDPEFYTPIAVIVGSLIISLSIFLAGGVGTTIAPAVVDTGTGSLLPSGTKVSLEVTDQDHIRGNSSAEVTIIEYSDLECPFCKQFHPTMQQVLSEYGDKVRWVYRHFPLDQIHPQARPGAEASECVAEQKGDEGFWTFADYVFDNQARIGSALFREAAGAAGANLGSFD
ncbi:MAG: DsbA family protein, partial [Candidatus Pacearchaeota archaeon]|nr:DsbA family protein [Candidatus Pacearchaeota archaeon]